MKPLKLYWVETDDHDEDWFIVAASLKEAQTLHENMEGYDEGDAYAEEILTIPEDIIEAEPGWPTHELLLSLGASFLAEEPTRVVEISGRRFCEGMLGAQIDEIVDDVFEIMGRDRPNKTVKPKIQ